MAERVVLVCDVCGRPAQESVTFRMGRRNLAKDLCSTHVEELVRNAHPPRRGRRPAAVLPSGASPTRSGPRSDKRSRVKRSRRRITDPATLEKRRSALEKARQALAEKRAAAKRAG
jgi:hypothetical protein